jgi:hypothetical protein
MANTAPYQSQYKPGAIQDAVLQVSIAGPNAANTVNTNAIDLGAASPYPAMGDITVQLASTIGTGANSKNINYALQHTNANSDGTADNGNWANIPELAIQVVAGNATNTGALAANMILPPSTKRYIRGTATGEANGGASTDSTYSVKLLF